MTQPLCVTLAGETYVLPFRSNGFWVDDARGKSYCECRTAALAKITAGILSEQFMPKASAQQRAINTFNALRGGR